MHTNYKQLNEQIDNYIKFKTLVRDVSDMQLKIKEMENNINILNKIVHSQNDYDFSTFQPCVSLDDLLL